MRLGLLLGFGLVVVVAAGQQPRPGTAGIAGQVTDARSHAPLPGAVVALNGRGAPPPARVITDADGRFAFSDLPPGVFGVVASRNGYFGSGDARDPFGPGRLVELTADHAVTDVTLSLWKLGAISGTVIAEGDPLVGIEVNALRRSLVASRWRYVNAATASTDDRGVYRLSGLPPGEYLVVARPDRDPETPLLLSLLSATPAASVDVLAAATAKGRGVPERDARVRTYPTTFFRSVPGSSLATRISIDAGADRAGIDFQLKALRGVRVAGTVSGLDGPPEEMDVHLVRADSSLEADPLDVAAAALESDGRFELTGVPPGKYVVTMTARPWWARMPVTVGTADVAGLKLAAHKGSDLRGRLEFDGRAAPTAAEIAQVVVQITPESSPAPNPASIRAQVSPDNTFTAAGLPAGRYFLRVGTVPRGWTLESSLVGSRDAIDAAFEIQSADVNGVVVRFVDHPLGGANGVVQDASGAPVSNATVLIFPEAREAGFDTGPQARRFRSVRSITNGAFNIGGLPPGAYLAVALATPPAPDWQEPARLDALASSATRIDVAAGPSPPITLSIAKVPVKK
ncbi:MAG TPA: carboxypeptidase-like regulatory domain-containing protein [Vicinamibacterales bacterium]|nr:carboxypeptidase-like regulatory domain-containing protein [Vicinamibacterales bacterium]